MINTNRMQPPIAPIGIDYIVGALQRTGVSCEVLDLTFAESPEGAVKEFFSSHSARLIGISFRNVDDCFWPAGRWYVPLLCDIVRWIREASDAPIVLGGVGYSLYAARLVDVTGADFGIHGDGEVALQELWRAEVGDRKYDRVPGLVWRRHGTLVANPPAWTDVAALRAPRQAIDNGTYFRRGGQIGVETKRGCPRACIYCADPIAKGKRVRRRDPRWIAAEIDSLLGQGADVFHFCDSEFNIPVDHALRVCETLAQRRLSERIRWYAYLAVTPFDRQLARQMAQAGCVGINFTGDAGNDDMLSVYGQPHRRSDLRATVTQCREAGITAMVDLLVGGPGETPESVAASVRWLKDIGPDCVGAALGIRLYPGTHLTQMLEEAGPLEENRHLRRRYPGPIDLLQPTYYVSRHLGSHPAGLLRELIGNDPRFFPPEGDPDPGGDEGVQVGPGSSHNYSDNQRLVAAIAGGARGAYWDILRRERGSL